MRYIGYLLMVISVSSVCLGGAVTISMFSELTTAVANHSTPIHLNAPNFVMSSSVMINYDCVIDIVCNSDVVFDGQRGYNFTFQDCNAIVGNAALDYRLTITRGGVHGAVIQSLNAPTRVMFNYCKFTYSNGNGVNIWPSTGANSSTVDVTCVNCESNSNDYDGYSLKNIAEAHNAHWQVLNLINCSATNNDPVGISNGAGDGVTSHDVKQIINLVGGAYFNNGKMGAVPTLGGEMYAKGVTFYGNNRFTPQGNIYVQGCKVTLEDCTFLNLTGTTSPLVHIFIDNSPSNDIYIKNCTFKGQLSDVGGVYVEGIAGKCVIEGCTFSNNYQDLRETVRLWSGLTVAAVRNCVFYDMARALCIETPSAVIQNNVFDSITNYAIAASNLEYFNQPANGHNLFFNAGSSFSNQDQFKTSDIEKCDPLFIDPLQGDFRLKASSPCINAGQETIGHGLTNIGAWQEQPISNLAPKKLFMDDFQGVNASSSFPLVAVDADPVANIGSWIQVQEQNIYDVQVTKDFVPGPFAKGNYLGLSYASGDILRGNFLDATGYLQYPLIVVSFDLYVDGTIGGNFEFDMRNSTDQNFDAVVLKNRFDTTGAIFHTIGESPADTGLRFEVNRWNTITYVLHPAAQNYDVYVGDANITNLPFNSPQAWVSQILWRSIGSDARFYLDNINAETRPLCTSWVQIDLSKDCKVSLIDFAIFAESWILE
jgi:hypothetical protein